MNTLFQDIRFAFRMLYKNLMTTLLVIAALGLGIGANTTIFSLMYSIMYMPIPVMNPERLVRINEVQGDSADSDSVSAKNFLDWKERCKTLEGMFLIGTEYKNLSGYGEPVRIAAHIASEDLFVDKDTGKMPMALGRTFIEEEFRSENSKVVILNHGFWKQQFGSDPSVLNSPILLDGVPYTVVGVLSTEMDLFESETRMWLPLSDDKISENREDRFFAAIGWLKEGGSVEEVQKEFDVIQHALQSEYPQANTDWSILIEPMLDRLYNFIKQTFIVLYGAAGFVLLIVCSNVASLLLARAGTRQKEISIRVAMGAGRLEIIRQLLVESVVLSLMGGLLGVLFSIWGIELLQSMLPSGLQSFFTSHGIDTAMLLFTLCISVVCGLIFGVVPAWQSSRVNLNDTLKEGGRSSGAFGSKQRFLKSLVVGEVALALVLLIGAGLMMNSFIRLQKADPGFRNTNVLTGHVFLDDQRYGEDHQKRAIYTEIAQQLPTIPGVTSVGLSNVVPISWGESVIYRIDGQEPLPNGESRYAQRRQINNSYFETLGLPVLQGRTFTVADERVENHKIIVNQKFATDNWGDENPIGKYVHFPGWSDDAYEVIGMVGNIRHFGLNSSFNQEIYIPYYEQPARHISFVISTNQPNFNTITEGIRSVIWSIDPNLPINSIRTVDESLADNVAFQRIGVIFLTGFSVIALMLSAMGVFGIMSYTVNQQSHDIGIRMALGAQVNQVIAKVIKQGLTLTFIGLGIGLVLSYLLKQILESQLYGIHASDPITYIAISLILILISTLACVIPARRAAKVDPMTALRCE